MLSLQGQQMALMASDLTKWVGLTDSTEGVTELQVEGIDGHLVADRQHGHCRQVAGGVGDVGAGGHSRQG